MKRKRRGTEEVNLTPLLDVIFSILFIVMFAGAKIQNDNSAQVDSMQNEIERLNNEVQKYESQDASYGKALEDVLVVTVDNIKNDKKHYLRIFANGYDDEEIILGVNNTQNVKNRIEGYFDVLVEDRKGQPVYVVYSCDENNIYKIEYDSINESLLKIEENNKEVFYKKTIKGEE